MFGFVIVNVSVVVPLSAMLEAPNSLLIEGGATTVTLAEAVPPVPPSVEVTFPVVLFFTPAVVPVTLTEIVQELPAESVPPDKLIVLEPAVAVTVPPQVLLTPGGLATSSPEGRLSVKATLLSAIVVFGLLIVKVRVVL